MLPPVSPTDRGSPALITLLKTAPLDAAPPPDKGPYLALFQYITRNCFGNGKHRFISSVVPPPPSPSPGEGMSMSRPCSAVVSTPSVVVQTDGESRPEPSQSAGTFPMTPTRRGAPPK